MDARYFVGVLVLVAELNAAQAVYFTGKPFKEEIVCDVQGRLVGKECGGEECTTCEPKCCALSPLPPASDYGQRSRQACNRYNQNKNNICNYAPDAEGHNVRVGEFPYFAAVGHQNKSDPNEEILWVCGGSLISEDFVLTAVFCVRRPQRDYLVWVLLGSVEPSGAATQHTQKMAVAEIFVHSEYSESSYYNNFALLRLTKPVRLTPFVQPACLFTEGALPVERAVIAGFGSTSLLDDAFGAMHKVDVPIIPNEICNASYNTLQQTSRLKNGIDSTLMCAGELGRDSCKGDGGAPLVVKSRTPSCSYHVLGLSSFGSLCGSKKPSVYTRVFSYLTWIENIVWP